jgi:plasmid stabilization system protein ParE
MPAMRKWPIKGFRGFLVFYRDEGTSVAILRVVHGSRDLPKLFGDGVSDR